MIPPRPLLGMRPRRAAAAPAASCAPCARHPPRGTAPRRAPTTRPPSGPQAVVESTPHRPRFHEPRAGGCCTRGLRDGPARPPAPRGRRHGSIWGPAPLLGPPGGAGARAGERRVRYGSGLPPSAIPGPRGRRPAARGSTRRVATSGSVRAARRARAGAPNLAAPALSAPRRARQQRRLQPRSGGARAAVSRPRGAEEGLQGAGGARGRARARARPLRAAATAVRGADRAALLRRGGAPAARPPRLLRLPRMHTRGRA